MKRIISIFSALILSGWGIHTYAQTAVNIPEEDTARQSRKQYTHWSVELKGGLSAMRGGSRDSLQATILSGIPRIAGGLSVSYTFNPLWGLSLEYMYLDYSNWGYDALSHEGALTGHVNLSNLLAPHRKGCSKHINFYGHLGAGLAAYAYERQDATLPPLQKSDITLVMPMGVTAEWNVSKTIALNLRGEYRWHSATGMLGTPPFQPGYGFWVGTGGLCVKFGGSRHIKNITIADYNRDADAAMLDALISERQAQLEARTTQLISDHRALHTSDVTRLNTLAETLQKELHALKDSLEILKPCCEATSSSFTLSNIEFNTGRHDILRSYHNYLDATAVFLKKHDNMHIRISGHTDNTGAEAKNRTLSQDRAEAVRSYLIKKGVSPEAIFTNSFSSTQPAFENNTPDGRQQNRRVEMEIFTQ